MSSDSNFSWFMGAFGGVIAGLFLTSSSSVGRGLVQAVIMVGASYGLTRLLGKY